MGLFTEISRPIILKRNNTPKRPGNYVYGFVHDSVPPIREHRGAVTVREQGNGLIFTDARGSYLGVTHPVEHNENWVWSDELGPIEFEDDKPEDHVPDVTKKVEESEVKEASEPQRLRQGWIMCECRGLKVTASVVEVRKDRFQIIGENLPDDIVGRFFSVGSKFADKHGIEIHWHDEPDDGKQAKPEPYYAYENGYTHGYQAGVCSGDNAPPLLESEIQELAIEAWRNTESAPIARAVFTLVDTYDKSLWATVDEDNPIGKASFDLGLKDFQAIVGVPFDDSDGDWVATLVIRQEASPAKPEQTPREIKPGQRWRNKYGATEYTVVQGESMWCVTVDCVVMGCPGWRHESDLQAWLNENAEYVPRKPHDRIHPIRAAADPRRLEDQPSRSD